MELRTYTSLWQVEKRIYSFYDWTLPFPLPVKVIGPFLLVGLPTWGLCLLLGIPFKPPVAYFAWIVPPAAAAYLSTRQIAEGKKIGELLGSYSKFYLQSKTFSRLRPWKPVSRTLVYADVWHHDAPITDSPAPELPADWNLSRSATTSLRRPDTPVRRAA